MILLRQGQSVTGTHETKAVFKSRFPTDREYILLSGVTVEKLII